MRLTLFTLACALIDLGASQQIWDIWQTTWNRTRLFKNLETRPPLQFVTPGAIGSGHIVVSDNVTYQDIVGFGGSLTDSSARLLDDLKTKNSTNYWSLLNYLFSAKEAANAAGLSYLRVPLGASDFAAKAYSYDDINGDTCLKEFDITKAPSYVFSVLLDIISVNQAVKVHLVPWSPPAWMKTGGTMNGGMLKPTMINLYASYLIKSLQGFKRQGIDAYAISIQNEPQYSNPTYPTSTLTAFQEGQIGVALKSLMKANGFPKVKLIGYEHNWSDATVYPVQLMKAAGDAFDGVSFHCYAGSVSQQGDFSKLYPKKEIYFTECSGVRGTDWWNDIKWFMDNVFFGAIENNAKAALMWNLALDAKGEPKYPGTGSCAGPGCRGIVTINANGTWTANQEFYAMAHLSKATIPRDMGGPSGRRIKVAVGGSAGWGLRVGAFVTGRLDSSDWRRYSLVVMNWNDSVGGRNPVDVKTTILFRGLQANYTFPVGLTTLWWYAPPLGASTTIESRGAQSVLQLNQ
ncbi:glycoside hydrolase family 30 protein [Hebeloma cylindrosporum]|uniref:Glycoside hydrolase family 30 protein n=1 Tax=Hebeloma cylindrosporum TaxID=76867 RepID=A0A0C3CE83_HEBCY|nr:glycoside hydrolase family 30 protein [Hebeloma cylindrosporum h7]